ncbi:MAG: glycosyltransferase [Planctomycetes bacterium]|nr:glycosyltransferase [Planctomycetota bacterium]
MRTLVLMAKAPRPGSAKTRLAGGAVARNSERGSASSPSADSTRGSALRAAHPGSPDVDLAGAARIAEGLFRDALATCVAAAAANEAELVLAFTPASERAWFAEELARAEAARDGAGSQRAVALRLVAQADGDLTPRLQAVTADAFARGARSVVVVGTDAPELSTADVERAFELLATRDVALGRSADGGYWLVGLARDEPRVFAGIPWSTERVRAATLARAAELGLAVGELDLHVDVDEPEDLAWLARWLAEEPVTRAAHVRAALAQLGR